VRVSHDGVLRSFRDQTSASMKTDHLSTCVMEEHAGVRMLVCVTAVYCLLANAQAIEHEGFCVNDSQVLLPLSLRPRLSPSSQIWAFLKEMMTSFRPLIKTRRAYLPGREGREEERQSNENRELVQVLSLVCAIAL
jgi:hypothetical protein